MLTMAIFYVNILDKALQKSAAEGKMNNLQEDRKQQTEKATFHIVVNTRAKDVQQQVLSFDDITRLAFPNPDGISNPIFTVSFKNADQQPSEGTLVAGESVKIKNGTIFNVTRTAQS